MDAKERERQTRARRALAEVVGSGGAKMDELPLVPLDGMTNRNYKITAGGVNYVVRIPGEGTEEYVNRAADEQAARLTSEIGVNAPVVFYDAKTGIQITKFIENSRSLRAPGVLDDSDVVRRAARAFNLLHTSGKSFITRFDEKDVAASYMDILRQKNARLPDGYENVQREAEAIRDALAKSSKGLVPCHNDPAPENLVDAGNKVYILDWEFGGNNDAFWDLGDFSVESGFSREQDIIFLEAYLGHPPAAHEYGRMVLQKSLVFLLWTLWGLLQEANQNPRPAYHFRSYWDYAMDRFTRCQEIMNGSDFAGLLEAVRKGSR